jgi:YbbR domain-containing protein
VRFFTENLSAKILSLLVAFLLWVALVDEPELIETVSVPVEYRNLNASLDLSPDAPNSVQIQVRGPRSRLGEVNPQNTNIVLDLGQMRQPSARTFTITSDSLNLPNRVSLVRAMPSQMRVTLERRLSKDLSVNPSFNAAPGLRVLHFEVSPPTVRVVGPASSIDAATTLGTEPIDLSTVDPSKPLRVNVLLSDPELSIAGSALVTVKLSVERIN